MFDLTLSFDNGPDPDVTPRVPDILRERGDVVLPIHSYVSNIQESAEQ